MSGISYYFNFFQAVMLNKNVRNNVFYSYSLFLMKFIMIEARNLRQYERY
jgi:hypothetical protein